jgi:hypothetical protein
VVSVPDATAAGEEVLFLNYAFETDPPVGLKLDPDDEPNRACIQLYHHVATQVELKGKRILEVSCGHGGGASFLTRALQPSLYTGLDLNPTGIKFCQQRHVSPVWISFKATPEPAIPRRDLRRRHQC